MDQSAADAQFKSAQRLTDDLLKENFRGSMTDDTKTTKLSKTNADCDKKLTKSDAYDANGKRVDGSGLGEPVKKKQKRPREEKSGDGGTSLSSSVSITPIASMQSAVSTSLSNAGLCLNCLECDISFAMRQKEKTKMLTRNSN